MPEGESKQGESSSSASSSRRLQAEGVESLAYQVVALITSCVDFLRQPRQRSNLFDQEWQALAVRVQQTCEEVQRQLGTVEEPDACQEPGVEGAASSMDNNKDEDRSRLVFQVAVPLLQALTSCYALLDRYEAEQQQQQQQQLANETASAQEMKRPSPRQRQGQQKPTPPPGLLSMQQYTDIAALLEVVVVLGVVPHVDAHVLSPHRPLPRALAGRLHQSSLLEWSSSRPCYQNEDEQKEQRCRELSSVVTALGGVMLLDRFRPMLLPRHLADLYAGMFQVEQLVAATTRPFLPTLYQPTCHILLPTVSTWPGTNCGTSPPPPLLVSPLWQARAFQTLLLQGTRAPPWLRRRVSRLLSELALTDLATVIRVFVLQAGTDRTAAAARLAQALVIAPATTTATDEDSATTIPTNKYYAALCDQLWVLVDNVVIVDESKNNSGQEEMHLEDVANLQVVWSVLDQLPECVLQGPFRERLCANVAASINTTTATTDVHRMIRRVRVLFSSLPASMNASKLCRVILSPLTTTLPELGKSDPTCSGTLLPPTTVLSLILRVASLTTVLKSQARQDAVVALSSVVVAMSCSTFSVRREETNDAATPVAGVDVAACALAYALAPNDWDVAGYRLALETMEPSAPSPSSQEEGKYELIRINRGNSGNLDPQQIAHEIEQRARTVIRDSLLPFLPNRTGEEGYSVDRSPFEDLPSRLLQVLLSIYCSISISDDTDSPGLSLPEIFCHESFLMVALATLPILCEECPPEHLLSDSSGESTALFAIMAVVFRSVNRCGRSDTTDSETSARAGTAHVEKAEIYHTGAVDHRFMVGASLLQEILCFKPESNDEAHGLNKGDNEVLLSVTSILLSLLIGMLELGVSRRSEVEEDTLKSFLAILHPLAVGHEMLEGELPAAWAGISEMASHAMALIGTRGGPTEARHEQSTQLGSRSEGTSPEMRIDQAERDLQSAEPPIRARGVVSLRHVASSLVDSKDVRQRIVALDETTEPMMVKDTLLRVLRICISALNDSESYVYLAAIQTIVAIADVQPSLMVPLLGMIVATGRSELPNALLVEASDEQRIKLTEALIFIIRRRSAVSEYAGFLIDLMVFGPHDNVPNHSSVEAALDIQRETHYYYTNGPEQGQGDESESHTEKKPEEDLRLKTGGPVFACEEGDTVRAGIVNVVAELLAVDTPTASARYVSVLISTAIDALRLDASRPVRRAGATLARELYASLLREQSDMFESLAEGNMNASIPFSVAMVASKEENLCNALERCLSGDDIADFSDEKGRQYDPATSARCEEAIRWRREAEVGGILAAAKLVLEESNETNPIARLFGKEKSASVDRKFIVQLQK